MSVWAYDDVCFEPRRDSEVEMAVIPPPRMMMCFWTGGIVAMLDMRAYQVWAEMGWMK
jgi:hypothetical protein